VGLKHQHFANFFKDFVRQQSHHCGIETLATLRAAPTLPPGSNRTIVGLKHHLSDEALLGDDEQQSHHCGIET